MNKITFKNIINESKKVKELPSDRWVTIEGKHILISNKGEIKAGLDKKYIGKKIDSFVDDVKKDDKPKSNKKESNKQEPKNIKSEFTDDQKKALTKYAGKSYSSINGDLRSGKLTKENKETIKHIDSAMKKSKNNKDVIAKNDLYRAADIPEIADALKNKKDLKGIEFTDKAYVSTTTDPSVARNFQRGENSMMFKISAPKGTPMIDMKEHSGFENENEILIGRNQKFKVKDVTYEKEKRKYRMPNGKTGTKTIKQQYIHLEIINDNSNTEIKENIMTDFKVNYQTIKDVMSEKYSQTTIEIYALGGNVEGVAKILKERGENPDNAGVIVDLIRSGFSEEEALNNVKQ